MNAGAMADSLDMSARDTWQLLASKRNSEVYAPDDRHVLKLFRDHIGGSKVRDEASVSAIVHGAGLPAPAVCSGVLCTDDGREAILFERAPGIPMSRAYLDMPGRIREFTRIIASMHRRIHATPAIPGLPPQKARIGHVIAGMGKLTLGQRQALLAMLETLPDGESVCHGDMHPSNLMLNGDEVTVIDWADAANGNPLCDVARSVLILRHPVRRTRYSLFTSRIYCRVRARLYLRMYFSGSSPDQDQFDAWLAINAALRLDDKLSPAVKHAMLRIVERGIRRFRARAALTGEGKTR